MTLTRCLYTHIGKERNDEETEESLEDNKNNSEEKERENQSADDILVAHLQELEDAHVQFARKSAKASNHEDVKREIQDMKDRVSDLKTDIVTGDAKKETLLWDAVNEDGDTCLHISTNLNKPETTRMLLEAGANVNIENSKSETALHNACRHRAIDEVTSLIERGANMVLNKNNETPALEQLLFENQDIEKVKKMMVAIHKSNDKRKFLKKIFQESQLLFRTKSADLIRAVVDTKKPDEDLAHFVNLQDPENNNDTGLHLACRRSCHASASLLLKAGGYQLKANRDALTPSLETFFTEGKISNVTDILVKGLIKKAKMNLLPLLEAIKYLRMEQTGGACLLSLVKDKSWYDKLAEVEGVGVNIAELASTMGAEFTEWLLVKTKEDGWNEKQVYQELIKVNKLGKAALAHCVDKSFWEKATTVVGAKIAQSASAMGPEFMEWLLVKTKEEGWNEREVYLELVEVNGAGKAALAHCVDSSVFWEKVALGLGLFAIDMAKSAVTMPLVFTEWLVQKTEDEGWYRQKVGVEQNRKTNTPVAISISF